MLCTLMLTWVTEFSTRADVIALSAAEASVNATQVSQGPCDWGALTSLWTPVSLGLVLLYAAGEVASIS